MRWRKSFGVSAPAAFQVEFREVSQQTKATLRQEKKNKILIRSSGETNGKLTYLML